MSTTIRRLGPGILGVLLALLSGCAIGRPYQTQPLRTETPDSEMVLVVLTSVVRGEDRERNRIFAKHTLAVADSLAAGEHPGLLGHAVRTQLLGSKAWTMTVWRDEASVTAFSRSEIHRDAITAGLPALVETRFARVWRPAGETPLRWAEVEQILATASRDYDGEAY